MHERKGYFREGELANARANVTCARYTNEHICDDAELYIIHIASASGVGAQCVSIFVFNHIYICAQSTQDIVSSNRDD